MLVALDRRGKVLDSEAFARRLARWRDDRCADVAFLIGGADGHGEPLLKKAALVLSFGAMTWPHLLARAMLAEQIYRAQQLLAGHPYHRAVKWRRFCLCSDEKPGLHWHPCASPSWRLLAAVAALALAAVRDRGLRPDPAGRQAGGQTGAQHPLRLDHRR